MTIQLPILLWTVICFCLLILILNNLLFKPMLAFMDKRNQRIADAARKKAEYEHALTEANAAIRAFREEEAKHVTERTAQVIDTARREADAIRQDAFRARDKMIEDRKAALEKESREIAEKMNPSVNTLAEAYIKTLVDR